MKKASDEGIDHIVIGRLLKATRVENKVTQRYIADRLGYRNVNFIYLIEQGRSNIPVGKILDLIEAYKLDRFFALAIIKHLHPDVWELFAKMTERNYQEMSDMDKLEKKVDEVYSKKAAEYGFDELKAI